LHNEVLGDDVNVLGAVKTLKGIRTLLIQRAVKGGPASEDEIQAFFVDNGWLPFHDGKDRAWFDPHRLLVVSDTHQGNLIRTEDRIMVPIDFRIQPVAGAMLDAVRKMI
jgi:hypothetical protein